MTEPAHVTTHVLDAADGVPAQGVSVVLVRERDGVTLASRVTDAQGRITDLGPARLEPGVYRLTFDTASYFTRGGRPTFYPRIDIAVDIRSADEHYHVPILLSPFAYTTYRGS
ncbi:MULTISPECIES: hydroxyisourate hydrolase [unclassified Rhodococcus (in: high G+C Gram-positive bacteria)]|uniref:hydroxyisourate hydrolase n=1 Tax=unclassified Rhodococcus (in: high G+C Gram-positive bacteria) TaxID=192944 RepID=UPI000482BC45|nr:MULTISPECIES: hydroxyisourate hydrolase [unclassified Rhodococcus (in: high G+C Gram-positive bacteria)]